MGNMATPPLYLQNIQFLGKEDLIWSNSLANTVPDGQPAVQEAAMANGLPHEAIQYAKAAAARAAIQEWKAAQSDVNSDGALLHQGGSRFAAMTLAVPGDLRHQ